MSSSREGKGVGKLGKEVLLHLARQLGPALDRVDGTYAPIGVRDVVRHFTRIDGPTPCEVRHEVLRLLERGWIASGWEGNDPDLLQTSCVVVLRVAGLMAARRMETGIGAATASFEIQMCGRSDRPLDARFSTQKPELDRALNRKGSILAAFYALVYHFPTTDNPVDLDQLVATAEVLAVQGVKARGGPTLRKGEKLGVAAESLAAALRALRPLLPGLTESKERGSGNKTFWSMAGAWPDVFVRDPKAKICDWQALANVVRAVVERPDTEL